jgi:predicted acyl esterase
MGANEWRTASDWPLPETRGAKESSRTRSHTRLAQGLASGARSSAFKAILPWHPLTREAQKPVTPGAVEEYQIEVMATANLFRKSHRICLEITSLDLPTGVAGATNAEYVPYHICSSKTVLHKIYHDRRRPSHLLVPVILD